MVGTLTPLCLAAPPIGTPCIIVLAPLVTRGCSVSVSRYKDTTMPDAAKQARFRVDGMDCAGCASKIDTAVRRMPGIGDVAVSVTAGTMTVHHAATTDLAAIQKT